MIRRKLTVVFLIGISLFWLNAWTEPKIENFGTVKIWDRNQTLLYQSAGSVGSKIPVTYEQFPKSLRDAAIASEDKTFWSNPGIDFKAIVRAAWQGTGGASTITQQVARNLVISPNRPAERSWKRKIREALIALRLNLTLSKKEILALYLNTAYFGHRNFGAQAAARDYFGKDVSNLSLTESATLVSLLSSSSPDRVLDLMTAQGFITQTAADEAKKEPVTLGASLETIKAPHFVDYIYKEVRNRNLPFGRGINVYTTLDYPTFLLAQDIAKNWVSKSKADHDLTNAALVLLKNDTGEILTMVGGIDYFDATNSGQVNLATSPRQPGSAIKPVTYAAAFAQGYTPATLIFDVRKVYPTKKDEGFAPNNYDGQFHGLVLAREALASSLNLPAVEMLSRIGLEKFLETAGKLGITTLIDRERYDLSLTLGGGEVTLLDLTNAYASFARGGQYRPPFAIAKITDDRGRILYEHVTEPEAVVFGPKSAQISYLITDILSDPKARLLGFGEKNPLVLSRPAAVKTGTTTDWHDNWTVGYTSQFTVGVWAGNNDNHPMREITGVTGAAPIWHQFFEEYLKGQPEEKFIRPEGLVEREICRASGKLVSPLCPEKITEIFITGTEPKEIDTFYKESQGKVYLDYLSDQNFLTITSPRNKAVFQSAPSLVSRQALSLEVNASPSTKEVTWFVDNQLFITTISPFSASWPLTFGKHQIKARGSFMDGTSLETEPVEIEVQNYPE